MYPKLVVITMVITKGFSVKKSGSQSRNNPNKVARSCKNIGKSPKRKANGRKPGHMQNEGPMKKNERYHKKDYKKAMVAEWGSDVETSESDENKVAHFYLMAFGDDTDNKEDGCERQRKSNCCNCGRRMTSKKLVFLLR